MGRSIDNLKNMVSENNGSIRDSYFAGNNKGIIIHIQDLHCNFDAQMSIYNIINELIDKYGLNLVTVEGCFGKLETAPFSNYPDEAIKEKVAKYFIKTGEVDGAAFAHIMKKSGFAFWGADDKNLYEENVAAYRVSIETKEQNKRYYDNMSSILEQFKQKAYSPQLKEFDSKMNAYKKEELEFSDYVAYLNGIMDKQGLNKQGYPNLEKLTKVLGIEKDIDFVEVDNQRSEYMDKLNKELSKGDLAALLDKSLYFKVGKITAADFYSYLEGISQKEGVTKIADNYPQLARYIEYIKLYSEIDNITLFKEIESIEAAIKDKLFRDDTQRKIDSLSRILEVVNDLFNLKLTKETLQYYRDHRREAAVSNLINFITETAPKYGVRYNLDPAYRSIDAQLPSLERFYQLAEERDGILVSNTIDKMAQEKANIAVLVSGGFHTDGIIKLLKERELSYVVITPKVNKLDEDNPYTRVLLGEKNEFDKFYDAYMEMKK
jgi:hypothetical protein